MFVNLHIQKLSTVHPSFLEDTLDLLRQLEELDVIPMTPSW